MKGFGLSLKKVIKLGRRGNPKPAWGKGSDLVKGEGIVLQKNPRQKRLKEHKGKHRTKGKRGQLFIQHGRLWKKKRGVKSAIFGGRGRLLEYVAG